MSYWVYTDHRAVVLGYPLTVMVVVLTMESMGDYYFPSYYRCTIKEWLEGIME